MTDCSASLLFSSRSNRDTRYTCMLPYFFCTRYYPLHLFKFGNIKLRQIYRFCDKLKLLNFLNLFIPYVSAVLKFIQSKTTPYLHSCSSFIYQPVLVNLQVQCRKPNFISQFKASFCVRYFCLPFQVFPFSTKHEQLFLCVSDVDAFLVAFQLVSSEFLWVHVRTFSNVYQ